MHKNIPITSAAKVSNRRIYQKQLEIEFYITYTNFEIKCIEYII